MSDTVKLLAEACAAFVELVGVVVIAAVALSTLLGALLALVRRRSPAAAFHDTRLHLARGILLGLEFLVAADIVHTVAVELTFTTVGVLAAIVLIRTFLSVALELEVSGRWPWQRDGGVTTGGAGR